MGRLIECDDQGNWRLKGLQWKDLHVGEALSEHTRQRIYGALCKLKDYEDTDLSPEEVERLNEWDGSQAVQATVKLQAEKRKHRWTPVSEMLPPEDKIMLVSCKTKKGLKSVNRAYYSAGCWHGSGSMSGVVAWMQLPDPHRPEEEEQ